MRYLQKLRTVAIVIGLGLFLSIGPLTGVSYAVDTFFSSWPFWSIDVTTAGIGYFYGSYLQFGCLVVSTSPGCTGVPAHIGFAQTTAPSLGATCGTSPTIVGTDTRGLITAGTGTPTSCVVTFNAAYTGTPDCNVTWQTGPLAAMSWTVTNTALTITQTATSSNKIHYDCAAPAGG